MWVVYLQVMIPRSKSKEMEETVITALEEPADAF